MGQVGTVRTNGENRRRKPAEGLEQAAISGDRGHQKAAAAGKAGRIEVKDKVAEAFAKLASRGGTTQWDRILS